LSQVRIRSSWVCTASVTILQHAIWETRDDISTFPTWALCASNSSSSCPTTFNTIAAETLCERELTAATCGKTAVPSICTGVNNPCTCRFDLGCVLLSVDPDNVGNIRHICTDPLLARVRYMALTGEAPTSIPKEITVNANAFNCSGNTGASSDIDPVNAQATATEVSVIHDDLEKAYACCVGKTTGSSALAQCVHTHVAHGAQPNPDTGAVATKDYIMRSHTIATCPTGVTLSNSDLVLHCQCMRAAHLIVTGVTYPGKCEVAATASSKRNIEQSTQSSVLATNLDTYSSLNSSPSSSASGLVGSAFALTLLVVKLFL